MGGYTGKSFTQRLRQVQNVTEFDLAKIRTLRRCALFRALTYRDLAILAPKVREETAKKGEWIAEEGKPTRGLIVITSGRVELTTSQVEGETLELGPFDYFGELSLADGDLPRGAGARALDSLEYLRIDPRDFHALSGQEPSVAGKLAQGVMSAISEKLSQARAFLTPR